MKILVLGSAAGGGFPQWNCACPMCRGARTGHVQARERTQSSIAVSPDGLAWVLLNASPDLGTQIRRNPVLQPCAGRGQSAATTDAPEVAALRQTPIRGVVLMDAQIDHVTGLLSLREGQPIDLYCTPCVFDDLTMGLPILSVLEHYCGVRWHMLPVAGERMTAEFVVNGVPGLRFMAMAIAGKAPPYSPHREAGACGDNIALVVEDVATGHRLFYAPGLAALDEQVTQSMDQADCVMVDGTFWQEDEMLSAGLSTRLAADMGHLPQSDWQGTPGMVSVLDRSKAARKLLIHINNSNPILDEHGEQRRELARHGIEVAHDGMEIEL